MNIKSLIESLLFVSPKPLSLRELSSALKLKSSVVSENIKELMQEYQDNDRGMVIIENNKKYQMSSSPNNAKVVQEFMQSEVSGELTPASLETLTIIAYRGPIKKRDIEKIRGINCSLILRNLLIRGLIEEQAASETEDNIYTVSLDFVKFLGVSSVKDLPDYDKFHDNLEIDQLLGLDEKVEDMAGDNDDNLEGKDEEV